MEDSMLFRELNHGKCKTCLLVCETSRATILINPIRDKVDRYLALLAYHNCVLRRVIDTHTHADHRSSGEPDPG